MWRVGSYRAGDTRSGGHDKAVDEPDDHGQDGWLDRIPIRTERTPPRASVCHWELGPGFTFHQE